jgi:hypothetical protein
VDTIVDFQALPDRTDSSAPRLRVLFIADLPRGQHIPDLSVVTDYIDAIRLYSQNEITAVNSREGPGEPCPDLAQFDAVLIHYTILISQPQYFPKPYWRAVKRFRGLKVAIMQDEFRWNDMVNWHLEKLGVHMILSSLSTGNLPRVYREPGLTGIIKCAALPGYIAERLFEVEPVPIARRPLDVVYRGRENHFWLGAFNRQKVEIAEGFLAHTRDDGLKCDISTKAADRMQGRKWLDFMGSSRATLGVEGGATIFDFDGEAERRTKAYLREHPDADFAAVSRDVLTPFEGNIDHRTITPRCFEAICLKTALILFPGAYRGILVPGRHYIPLERDFSNIRDVVAKLRDVSYLQNLVDRAYREIAEIPDYRFRTFVKRLDHAMDEVHASLRAEAPRRTLAGTLRRLFST